MEAVGPYSVLWPIASGGFGQVFLGRQAGVLGRLVALKGLSAEKQDELEAVAMLIDEARIASRVQHPNVVPILDVVEQGSRIWLVMEHVHGETLARLLVRTAERNAAIPPRIARAVACGVLRGLHAAHQATDTAGRPLSIIHRDVSPHNVIVSAHGVARVLDFGIAKAVGRLSITRHGQLKGKLAYMAPEQFSVDPIDLRVDIYAAAVLIAELFAGRRLSEPQSDQAALDAPIREVVARGLCKHPDDRYATAADMADAIEATGDLASEREVAEWLCSLVGNELDERRARWEREGDSANVAQKEDAPSDATASAIAIAPPAPAPIEETPPEVVAVRAEPRARTTIIGVAVTVATVAVALSALLRETPPRVLARAGLPSAYSAAPLSSSAPPPSTIAAPSVFPSVAASTQPLPSASPASKPLPTSKPTKPNPDCDPPYKLDGRGVKVLKLECLR